MGTPEAGYVGSVRLVENRLRIGQATEGETLCRIRAEHQICGVICEYKDTVVKVTKNKNKVYLMVLVSRGSKGWCN